MLFDLDFANNIILLCFSFFFLIINLYFLIAKVIVQIFNPITELVVPIEIPVKEAKAEMEIHPVIVEVTIVSSQYNTKLCKLFNASFSLTHFDLFLQLNNFLFHLFFSV